jgi:S-adenosylmethionine synthetase
MSFQPSFKNSPCPGQTRQGANQQTYLFTSESVSEGHPDKLADRISDRILDAFLERDPRSRVACETMLADQCVIVAGEFKTRREEDYESIRQLANSLVRQVLRDTGYTR